MSLKSYWQDFISILFPRTCGACRDVLTHQEEAICTTCLYHLPFTDFHYFPVNPTAKRFWGKLEFENAASMFYLTKSSLVESLIHQIKYNNKPEIAYFLGKTYGDILKKSPFTNGIDVIVPVPLHPKKLKARGYNQSSFFANGLSESLQIPSDESLLRRVVNTATQTKKDRIERYENVENVFESNILSDSAPMHILLVDDVLTTGATMCAAAISLLANTENKISLATIAKA